MKLYDFIVIGGGPTGLYTAWQLARRGFEGLVVEEHPIIGVPRYCSGVVGREAFERFSLPRESIQREMGSVVICSPSGRRLRIAREDTGAYIIDRSLFDQGLYTRASEEGVKVRISSRCKDIRVGTRGVEITLESFGKRMDLMSRVVVIATGVNYAFHRKLGFRPPGMFLDTCQVDVEGVGFQEVEVYLGRMVAPNSFAWVVPVTGGVARVGVSTYRDSNLYLRRFLSSPALRERVLKVKGRMKRKPIPISPVERSYRDRVILLGDAAGQVKVTTGGGVFYGLLCAEAAVDVLSEALRTDRFNGTFRAYERLWRERIGRELRIGAIFRKIFSCLEDEEIERLIDFVSTAEGHHLVSTKGSFDWHGRLLLEFLKVPFLWKGAYRALKGYLKDLR